MSAPGLLKRLSRRARRGLDRRLHRMAINRALRAVAAFPSAGRRKPHGLGVPLVVSLTSYPTRFPTLALTLRSLLDQ